MWSLVVLSLLTGRGLAGWSPISLYPLYGTALFLGWGAGNLYVARTRGEAAAVKRILLPVYVLTPPGVLFLLWATAGEGLQLEAPLAPVYASAIFAILFLVPLTFARASPPRRNEPPDPTP